jgi:hypothetical protein
MICITADAISRTLNAGVSHACHVKRLKQSSQNDSIEIALEHVLEVRDFSSRTDLVSIYLL